MFLVVNVEIYFHLDQYDMLCCCFSLFVYCWPVDIIYNCYLT